jgi:Protein of unknown function (DUF3995)
MLLLVTAINTCILLFLSGLHAYWGFGGTWGADQAIPSDLKGKKIFIPGVAATIIVATVLLAMALLLFLTISDNAGFLPHWLTLTGLFSMSVIFTLRAIGEFRYVGFFKSLKGTGFAEMDTRFYSPLCLYLGITILWLACSVLKTSGNAL